MSRVVAFGSMVRAALVLGCLLTSIDAFADRPRRGLQKYEEDTSEVRDLNRRPSKVRTWVESDEPDETFEFPWKQVMGTLGCLALAAPFAFRYFKNVNGEIAAAKEDQAAPVRVRRKIPSTRE